LRPRPISNDTDDAGPPPSRKLHHHLRNCRSPCVQDDAITGPETAHVLDKAECRNDADSKHSSECEIMRAEEPLSAVTACASSTAWERQVRANAELAGHHEVSWQKTPHIGAAAQDFANAVVARDGLTGYEAFRTCREG
jgi:hypothetical protein